MDKIKGIIRNKPPLFVIVSAAYIVFIILWKWNIHPNLSTLLFLAGGLLGIYFLDFAEVFFKLEPSPFSSVVFCAGFAAVSLFIATSSGSFLAGGLVLTLYLILIMRQAGELRILGNLDSWYRMINGPVSHQSQNIILAAFIILFLVESVIFIG